MTSPATPQATRGWWPRSLLGRNLLLMAVLIVLGQLVAAMLVRQMIFQPRVAQVADGVARNVGALRAGLQAQAQRGAVPPRDDRGGNARLLQQFDAMAIQGVKALEGFARFTEVQTAIGEHPIDIEKHHAHRLGL